MENPRRACRGSEATAFLFPIPCSLLGCQHRRHALTFHADRLLDLGQVPKLLQHLADDPASFVDVLRVTLEYLSATSAASMTIPSLSVAAHLGAADPTKKAADFTFSYTGMTLRDLRNGRIGSTNMR